MPKPRREDPAFWEAILQREGLGDNTCRGPGRKDWTFGSMGHGAITFRQFEDGEVDDLDADVYGLSCAPEAQMWSHLEAVYSRLPANWKGRAVVRAFLDHGQRRAFTISSVTSAHVVVCSTASGLTNETFDPAAVKLVVSRDDAPLIGDWTVKVSNNFVPDGSSSYGSPPNPGRWVDITSAFSPTIASVVDATPATRAQFAQADVRCRSIQVTFTPRSGYGTVDAQVNCHSWGC